MCFLFSFFNMKRGQVYKTGGFVTKVFCLQLVSNMWPLCWWQEAERFIVFSSFFA